MNTLIQKLCCISLVLGTVGTDIPGQQATSSLAQSSAPNSKNQLCSTPLSGKRFARTDLYFGSRKPSGIEVTEGEFNRFLDREVTPRFPDGLTLVKGLGQFKGSSGKVIQETSRVLILLYPFRDGSSSKKIETIRKSYKTRFQQESVLRVDDESCVSF